MSIWAAPWRAQDDTYCGHYVVLFKTCYYRPYAMMIIITVLEIIQYLEDASYLHGHLWDWQPKLEAQCRGFS
jgi:hypothetical protein